jgi:hypothetical protein
VSVLGIHDGLEALACVDPIPSACGTAVGAGLDVEGVDVEPLAAFVDGDDPLVVGRLRREAAEDLRNESARSVRA